MSKGTTITKNAMRTNPQKPIYLHTLHRKTKKLRTHKISKPSKATERAKHSHHNDDINNLRCLRCSSWCQLRLQGPLSWSSGQWSDTVGAPTFCPTSTPILVLADACSLPQAARPYKLPGPRARAHLASAPPSPRVPAAAASLQLPYGRGGSNKSC